MIRKELKLEDHGSKEENLSKEKLLPRSSG